MKKKLTIALMMMAGLMACTSEEDSEQRLSNDGTIRFAPQMVNDWNTTRGERYVGDAVENQSYTTLKTTDVFHVSGYRYDPTKNETIADVSEPNFLNNVDVEYNGEWKASGNYIVPLSNERTVFFGWFVPSGTEGVSLATSQSGGLQLTYTVPENIAKHPDLLVAKSDPDIYSDDAAHTVPLCFMHQLTEINFIAGEDLSPGTITEIAFLNVCTQGTLSATNGTWTNIDSPAETVYTVNFNTRNGTAKRTGETILGGLMMIPQTFTNENQRIRVKMTVNGTPYTTYADLKATAWMAGTPITYVVTSSTLPQLLISTLTLSGTEINVGTGRNRTLSVTTNSSGGALSVESSNNNIATATIDNNGIVTIMGVADGTATVTVTAAATEYYAAISQPITVKVVPSTLTFTKDGVSFKMKYVEAGTFSNFASTGTSPATNVTVTLTKDYYIGETEVTNALWKKIMGSVPSTKSTENDVNHPVDYVNRNDILTANTGFMPLLNDAFASQRPEGMVFALPTQAQWQWAAMGGIYSQGYKYAGGNTLNNVAWWQDNSGSTTHAVAQKQTNELGLYDMTGNVWEWCSDILWTPAANSHLTDPTGGTSGSQYVVTGAGWASYDDAYLKWTGRYGYPATQKMNYLGLRLVLVQE